MTSSKCRRLMLQSPRSKEFQIGIRNLLKIPLKINLQKFKDLWIQDLLLDRRSNFQGNQFPLATEAARKAAAAPIRGKAFNQSRPFNVTRPRFGAKPFQKNAANGGFIVKRPFQTTNVVSRQKPQTLDLRFANMKEQRMRVVFSSQSQPSNNNGGGPRRNGNGVGQPRGVPRARNRFQNSY